MSASLLLGQLFCFAGLLLAVRQALALRLRPPSAAVGLFVREKGGGSPLPASAGISKRLPPSRSPRTLYFFSARRKTGTELLLKLCRYMREVLGGRRGDCAKCTMGILNTTTNGTWCRRGYVSEGVMRHVVDFYPASERFFFVSPLPTVFGHFGEDYRMVSTIRDPFTTFVSTFIYDQKGPDNMGTTKKHLEGLSLREALRLKASNVVTLNRRQLDEHRLVEARPQVLEVRFEDFQKDFDATAGRIFSFMVGPELQKSRHAFLQLARKADERRWPSSKRTSTAYLATHVSDPEEKKRVVAKLRELCDEGDPAVTKALAFRGTLGYGRTCPAPEGS